MISIFHVGTQPAAYKQWPVMKGQKRNLLDLCFRQASYHYKRGTTAILSSKTVPIDVEEVSVRTIEPAESMDTSS
jgi:hypothetical protein